MGITPAPPVLILIDYPINDTLKWESKMDEKIIRDLCLDLRYLELDLRSHMPPQWFFDKWLDTIIKECARSLDWVIQGTETGRLDTVIPNIFTTD